MIWLQKYKMFFVSCGVAVVVIFLFISKPKDEMAAKNETALQTVMEEKIDSSIELEQEVAEGPVFVDVKGAVSLPGIYEAKDNDRVLDAIEYAGGLLEIADEKQINFAQKVQDEMVIYVPEKGETIENDAPPLMTSPSNGQANGKVNINRAELSELETLPGIGPAKAKAIIDYREQQGHFKKVEDIQNISGIGEKTFEKLQESISVN